MTKREVIKTVLAGKKPPYVPWDIGFTVEAAEKLTKHFGNDNLHNELDNHIITIGGTCHFEDIGNDCYRDFGRGLGQK